MEMFVERAVKRASRMPDLDDLGTGDVLECILTDTDRASVLHECGWDSTKARGGLYDRHETWLM